MLDSVAVWHELWPEQQQHHHDHVAQRQHDDATYGHHAVRFADIHHYDAARAPSPASRDGKQHDDHASHAYDDHQAIEPFVIAQQRNHDNSAAALTLTPLRLPRER
jgi:hypothetical protein